MDPEANLKEQREIARQLVDGTIESEGYLEERATRLAELVLALDEWIRSGGFLPRQWSKGR